MLEELKHIIAIEGTNRENGLEARKAALEHWIGKYVSELVIENSVLKKHLNPSELDVLKSIQCYQIAEQLLEHHAEVITEGNKIRVKTLVLNKYFPKNKKE